MAGVGERVVPTQEAAGRKKSARVPPTATQAGFWVIKFLRKKRPGAAGATVQGVGTAGRRRGRVGSGRRPGGAPGVAPCPPPVLLYAFAFPASFSRRIKRSSGASIPRRI
jgi:hypothetical protein